MPRILRSASNTPQKSTRSKSSTSTPTRSSKSTPSRSKPPSSVGTSTDTPTRKQPCCAKCGRPRAGHPRSGCPYSTDTPSAASGASASEGEENVETEGESTDHLSDHDHDSDRSKSGSGSDGVTDALGSMHLNSPKSVANPSPTRRLNAGAAKRQLDVELEDTKGAIRERRRSSGRFPGYNGSPSKVRRQKLSSPQIEATTSLASLATDENQMLDELSHSQPFDTLMEEEEEVKFRPEKVKWPRQLMPCTLIRPSPASSFSSLPGFDHEMGSQAESVSSEAQVAAQLAAFDTDIDLSQSDTIKPLRLQTSQSSGSSSSTSRRGPKTVTRTMSIEEQDSFINGLQEISTVSAFSLALENIPSIQTKAMKVGLFSHAIQPPKGAQEGLLVIGRDGQAVQSLVETLERNPVPVVAKGGSAFTVAAGGAVVGAAATFAGLAFV